MNQYQKSTYIPHYDCKTVPKVTVERVNRLDNRAKRATRLMHLGKTIENTSRGTRCV